MLGGGAVVVVSSDERVLGINRATTPPQAAAVAGRAARVAIGGVVGDGHVGERERGVVGVEQSTAMPRGRVAANGDIGERHRAAVEDQTAAIPIGRSVNGRIAIDGAVGNREGGAGVDVNPAAVGGGGIAQHCHMVERDRSTLNSDSAAVVSARVAVADGQTIERCGDGQQVEDTVGETGSAFDDGQVRARAIEGHTIGEVQVAVDSGVARFGARGV